MKDLKGNSREITTLSYHIAHSSIYTRHYHEILPSDQERAPRNGGAERLSEAMGKAVLVAERLTPVRGSSIETSPEKASNIQHSIALSTRSIFTIIISNTNRLEFRA